MSLAVGLMAQMTITLMSITTNRSYQAKKFYADVFHWDFKAHGPESKASPDEIATFAFPDPSLEKLSGGIKKVDGQEGKVKEGGPVVYLYVEDLGDVAQVCLYSVPLSSFHSLFFLCSFFALPLSSKLHRCCYC